MVIKLFIHAMRHLPRTPYGPDHPNGINATNTTLPLPHGSW